MTAWIATSLIIAFHLYVFIRSFSVKKIIPASRKKFYLRDIGLNITILVIFWLLAPAFFQQPDFKTLGKGYIFSYDIFSGVIPFFTMPLLFSLLDFSPYKLKEMGDGKTLYGMPLPFYPNNWSEFALFNLFMVTGVVFEELISRQALFIAFNATLGLQGDVLLIVSSFLFAIGHAYQGWKGVLGALFTGLLLGKAFQMSENIFFPIVLHFCANLTGCVLAFRRIKDLKKTKQAPELAPVELKRT